MIIDIIAEIEKEEIQKFGLELGQTIFATPQNIEFFKELDNKAQVSYTSGGSILNTLRVASWCLNMEPNNKNYKLTMLGSVGNDKITLNLYTKIA